MVSASLRVKTQFLTCGGWRPTAAAGPMSPRLDPQQQLEGWVTQLGSMGKWAWTQAAGDEKGEWDIPLVFSPSTLYTFDSSEAQQFHSVSLTMFFTAYDRASRFILLRSCGQLSDKAWIYFLPFPVPRISLFPPCCFSGSAPSNKLQQVNFAWGSVFQEIQAKTLSLSL